jgi:hypothetical protein
MNHPDKNDYNNCDRRWKITNLFDQLNDTYAKVYSLSEHLAVDEIIVIFKVRVILKQYIPEKC